MAATQASEKAERFRTAVVSMGRPLGCWVLGVGCWVLGVGCWVSYAPGLFRNDVAICFKPHVR